MEPTDEVTADLQQAPARAFYTRARDPGEFAPGLMEIAAYMTYGPDPDDVRVALEAHGREPRARVMGIKEENRSLQALVSIVQTGTGPLSYDKSRTFIHTPGF